MATNETPENIPAESVHSIPISPTSRSSNDGSSAEGSQKASVMLDWDGPEDELNPFNWSSTARWVGTLMPGIFCFVVTLSSSIYAAGVYEIQAKFNVSMEVALLGLSLYVLGLGLGPMLSAPLSEVFGRKAVYIVNLPIFALFTLGSGLAQNIQTLIICRIFAGLFGGPSLTVSAGSFVDIWDLKISGLAVSIQAIATFAGPALGPVIGGKVVEQYGWRWTMYLTAILTIVSMIPLLFMSETYKPVLLKRRAIARGQPLPPKPDPKVALKMIFTITLMRPIQMLLKEPIVQAVSVYSSFAFAVLFGFFEAYPFAFQKHYKFTLAQTGYCFFGITVGILAGCAIYLLQDRLWYMPAHKKYNGNPPPEIRLIPAMIGSFLMPVGLFWFAWTANGDIHWIVPVMAGAPFGAGLVLVFLTSVMYLLEVYPPLVAASAMASLGLLRYVFAMAFPLFTVTMFERLGVAWATSVYGFVSLALLPIPWVFSRYGPTIRSLSNFNAIEMKG